MPCIVVNLEQLGAGRRPGLRRVPGSCWPPRRSSTTTPRTAPPTPSTPTTCRSCRCCTRRTGAGGGDAARGAADRPAVLRQHEPRRRAWLDRVRATGRTVKVLDSAPVRCRARRLDPEVEGRAQRPLLRDQPLRAGARRALPFARHAGHLGAHAADPSARRRSRTACSGSKASSSSSSSPRTSAPRRSSTSRRAALARFARVRSGRGLRRPAGLRRRLRQGARRARPSEPWQPTRINLGSGKDYKSGWLNLDMLARTKPDLLLDLAGDIAFPLCRASETVGPVRLAAGSVALINANNVLEHVPDLPALMSNCLTLARDRRRVPYRGAVRRRAHRMAGPDARPGDERELLALLHRLVLVPGLVRAPLRRRELHLPRHAAQALRQGTGAFMRLVLRKSETTDAERTPRAPCSRTCAFPTTTSMPTMSIGRRRRRGGAPILCRHAPSRRSRRRSSRPQGGHSPAPADAFPSWRRRPTRRLCHGRGGRCRGSSFIAMT